MSGTGLVQASLVRYTGRVTAASAAHAAAAEAGCSQAMPLTAAAMLSRLPRPCHARAAKLSS